MMTLFALKNMGSHGKNTWSLFRIVLFLISGDYICKKMRKIFFVCNIFLPESNHHFQLWERQFDLSYSLDTFACLLPVSLCSC
mmetsp:Transcript_16570/g.20465  ORF Transcript_16570/g.20465 Transcript_16570/m.20465 type:complete len:83 (-) Transcript_16570:36-284(-)